VDLGAIAEFGGVGAALTVGVGDDVTGAVGEVDDVGGGGVTATGATFGTECGAGGIGSIEGVPDGEEKSTSDVRVNGTSAEYRPGVVLADGDCWLHVVPPIPSEMQMMKMAIKGMRFM
jgi:hypothetical protein